ncbi:MAG: helix-turn-helix transcriptional regulator [Gluconacetobacter sp.]
MDQTVTSDPVLKIKAGWRRPGSSEGRNMARKPCAMPMHVEDIKAELRKRYGSLASISRQLGLNPNALTAAIHKPGNSVRSERRIAELLEMAPHEVFPDRFHKDGTPISHVVDRKPTCRIPDRLRANGVAA